MNLNGHASGGGSRQKSHDPGAPRGMPRWETAVMVLSFGALWCWWLVLQRAHRNHTPLPAIWFLVLALLVAALAYIFVRRSARVLAGLKENARRK